VGGKSFFDRREVKDLLAYAGCLVNPDDDVSLLRIINTPARGISERTIEQALELSIQKKCSLFRTLQSHEFRMTLTARAKSSVAEFLELLDEFETRVHAPLANLSE